MRDDWDPTPEPREWRIYLDDCAQLYAVVDEEDYYIFSRWLWLPKVSRGGWKMYARRAKAIWGESGYERTITMYLHVEIMKLIEPPPTIFHTIADHRNGDSLMCRRKNLRWATPKMNRANINPRHPPVQLGLL